MRRIPSVKECGNVVGRLLVLAFAAAFLLGSSVSHAGQQRLTTVHDLWKGEGASPSPRSVSLVAEKSSGRFGEQVVVMGSLSANGRPALVMGGGRSGTNESAGSVVIGSVAPDGSFQIAHVFEGAARKPGYGRILATGTDSQRRPVLVIGRPDRVDARPVLEFWRMSRGGVWDSIQGPDRGVLVGLNDARLVDDVTGDGESDLVLVHQRETESVLEVFSGGETGFSGERLLQVRWPRDGEDTHPQIFHAGDIDGDGRPDLLLGFQRNESEVSGKVALVKSQSRFGSGGFDTIWTGASHERFGKAVLVADLDADGIQDLVIGAPGADGAQGKISVFRGRLGGWDPEPAVVVTGDGAGGQFGYSMAMGRFAGSGHDGFLVIGAPGSVSGTFGSGRAYCIALKDLRSGKVVDLAGLRLVGGRFAVELGIKLCAPGDLDGDGYDDLVLGLPSSGINGNKAGRVDVLFGSSDWPVSGTWSPGFLQVSPPDIGGVIEAGLNRADPSPPRYTSKSVIEDSPWTAGGATALGLALVAGCLWGWRRRFEQVIRDRERIRIIGDLHDEISPGLSMLSRPTPISAPEIVEAAREVSTGIERTMRAIHPGRQSLLDLACALAELAEGILRDLPMRRRFAWPEELPTEGMRNGFVNAVLRAAQEAINNVRKHSQATEVLVGMTREGRSWVVFIQDNGTGLKPDEKAASRRGISGMKGRLDEIGGRCELIFDPGVGTTVRLSFPAN